MSVIILLLIASLSVSLVFLAAFIWSIRHKQFEDPFSPPRRILFDEDAGAPDGNAMDDLSAWTMSPFTKDVKTPEKLN